MPHPQDELAAIVDGFHRHPGLRAKAKLGLVTEVLGPTDWLTGPGDDAAVIPDKGHHLLAAGEALWPPFVEQDPFGAGIGAVVANVNDVAAMGGRCLGIVDTVVGPEPVARRILEGLRYAGNLYGVPIVGGHLTLHDGPPALSAFALGTATTLLSARRAAPGQALLHACSLEGQLREDFPFYPSYRERGGRCAGDVALLPRLADEGSCVAAKDVSMAGLLGSLAMLLEPTQTGVTVDLEAVRRPAGVPLAAWLAVFPSFSFLLCAPQDRAAACIATFAERGLACSQVGILEDTGQLRVGLGAERALLLDLRAEAVTRLAGR